MVYIMTSRKSRFFFQNNGFYYYIEDLEQDLQVQKEQQEGYNYYKIIGPKYDQDLESLRRYYCDFHEWADVLKEITLDRLEKPLKINLFKFYNIGLIVKGLLKQFTSKEYEGKKYNILDNYFIKSVSGKAVNVKEIKGIDKEEFIILEKPNSGGLQSFDKNFAGKEKQYYGYDFNSFYPYVLGMSRLKVPIGKPEFYNYETEDFDFSNLNYGIYKVRILCNDFNFNKKFAFNKKDWYSHIDIQTAYKNKEKYGIDLILLDDEELGFNAMIYDKTDLVEINQIFNFWYETLIELKQTYNNAMTKQMLSSAWGYLIEHEKIYVSHDEFIEKYEDKSSKMRSDELTDYKITNIEVIKNNDDFDYDYTYTLVKCDNPYKYHIGRIKPFFTAYCRKWLFDRLEREGIKDNEIVRIHTDGIILTRAHDWKHKNYNPKEETKYTGVYKWFNLNSNDLKK